MSEAPRGSVPVDLNGPVDVLVETLDRAIETGVLLHGDLEIGVAEVALVRASLRLYLQGVQAAPEARRPRVAAVLGDPRPPTARTLPQHDDTRMDRVASEVTVHHREGPGPVVAAPLARPSGDRTKDALSSSGDAAKGVAHLVVVLLDILRRVLEGQALRRVDGGDLSEESVERLGQTFVLLEEQIEILTELFSGEREPEA